MLQDLSPLTWRDEMGFPRLMVFHPGITEAGFEGAMIYESPITPAESSTLEDRIARLQRSQSLPELHVTMTPRMPQEMSTCYNDIVGKVKLYGKMQMEKLGRGRIIDSFNIQLKARFSGLIPDDVKLELHRAYLSGLFINFFIIAEVEKWEWNVRVVSRRGDSLLIGYDGYHYWLIKAFDTTTVERAMAEEFSVKSR